MFRVRRLMRRRATTRTAVVGDAGHVAPTEPAPATAETLKELAELREQGILTEEEFAAEKKKLLGM